MSCLRETTRREYDDQQMTTLAETLKDLFMSHFDG